MSDFTHCRCPRGEYTPLPGGHAGMSLFIGGGITDCPDWQTPFIESLEEVGYRGVVLNPRRPVVEHAKWNDDLRREQVSWEWRHLHRADGILLWFPPEAVASMTMFELGRWLASDKTLFIGFHNENPRKALRLQVELERPDLACRTSLNQLRGDILAWNQRMLKRQRAPEVG